MIVALLSEDHKLYDLCSAILAEQNVVSSPLLVGSNPGGHLPHADLYIWDYSPEWKEARCIATRDPHRHILLVERSCLTSRGAPELRGLQVVLKPVVKAALAAWLIPALKSSTEAVNSIGDGQERIIASLTEANIRMQEYELGRSSFLAKVTHDFRAPLTAMNGYCGLLLAGALGPLTDLQREVLTRTQNSLKRLTRMSSAMLQLNCNSPQGHVLTLEEGNLQECLRQAIHEVQPALETKRLRITLNLEPPLKKLLFDAEQLERVLINLLDNACRFTPEGGQIEIRGYPCFGERRSTRVRGMVATERRTATMRGTNAFRVDIYNPGPSIPVENLSCMFDEYTSFGDGSKRTGSGLGLAICKTIVQEHRGRIWAENLTGGPRFSFMLPLEQPSRSNFIRRKGQDRKDVILRKVRSAHANK